MIVQAFTKHGALINEIVIDTQIDEDNYFEVEDILGRKWRLIPVINPDIKMPFIIRPIYLGEKQP